MHSRHRRRSAWLAAAWTATLSAAPAALAQEGSVPQSQEEFLRALDAELEGEGAQAPAPSLTPPANLWGGAQFRLLDLSMDTLFAAGTSTERDESIENLQAGGHDPHQRGFTLQQVELSATAAVDPYFNAETHLIYFIDAEGESQFELEEVFLTTTALPAGLQVKAGQYFSEFGIINAQHPHQWDFIDQPVINSRLFGADGMRGQGGRLSWLTPLPWFGELLFGVQNADGETMTSFLGTDEEEAPGGHLVEEHDVRSLADMAYTGRFLQGFDLTDETSAQLGFSGAWGPNSAGSGTRTSIYGADFRLKWQPPQNDSGWPFVLWQSELMHRTYSTDLQAADPDGVPGSGDEFTVPGDTLLDDGYYSYLLWGFRRNWIAGFRYEQARTSGDGATPSDTDPFRDDRTRMSPIVMWQPTHFSRLRLQYNYDRADHLRHNDAHSVWLGVEFLIGRHPAHKY